MKLQELLTSPQKAPLAYVKQLVGVRVERSCQTQQAAAANCQVLSLNIGCPTLMQRYDCSL